MYIVGIDIGGTKTAAGIFREDLSIIDSGKIKTPRSERPEQIIDEIISFVSSLLLKNGLNFSDISKIGIGVPSLINFKTGVILKTHNIPCLENFNICSCFEKSTGVDTVADNDANLAALAEYTFGAGKGFEHMIYSTASTGIGGGIIINGNLFRGSGYCAGEIGHMIITENSGALCGCNNRGCFESHASGAYISKNAEILKSNGISTDFLEEISGGIENINGESLYKAYIAGDKAADMLFSDICHYLGLLYYNLYKALCINCFVIGGGLTHFGEIMFKKIEDSFLSFNHEIFEPVYFLPSKLGQDFGIIGAALLCK